MPSSGASALTSVSKRGNDLQTETVIDPSERVTTIKFAPEQYDAFPLSSAAWLDWRLIERNRDREAVAHAILLFPFISGRLSPSRGCGIDVSQPLRDFFSPRHVMVEGVEMAPARIPSGTRTAILCDGSYRSAAVLGAFEHDLAIRLSEGAYTTSIGPRNAIVSSNFGLFARRDGQLNAILPTIAAAVLFAEDLGLARLVLPVLELTAVETDLFARLTKLLAAVNIAVEAPLLGAGFETLQEFLASPIGLATFLSERHQDRMHPEDLPDFWIAKLLSARSDGEVAGEKEAARRLRELHQAGAVLSDRERGLVMPDNSAQEPSIEGLPSQLKTVP